MDRHGLRDTPFLDSSPVETVEGRPSFRFPAEEDDPNPPTQREMSDTSTPFLDSSPVETVEGRPSFRFPAEEDDPNPTQREMSDTSQIELKDVALAMEGVCYDITTTSPRMSVCGERVKRKIRLLHGVNFYAQRGTCNAILGRSGG